MRPASTLSAFLVLVFWACGGAGDTDVNEMDTVVVDEGGVDTAVPDIGTADEGGGGPFLGSCLAHITTQCSQYELPAGVPAGEFEMAEAWCTSPLTWTDGPCPTEGLLGTCTVPPTDGAGYMTTKYLYYGAALIAGAQTTCAGYGNASWSTP